MADPLSIASGIIAVLGAAGKTAQGLDKLLALRHADEELFALINEVRPSVQAW